MQHTDLIPGRHQIIIYKNPEDFPDDFVVNVWDIYTNTLEPVLLLGMRKIERTIEDARQHIPKGFINMGRFVEDDPAIYEVWI